MSATTSIEWTDRTWNPLRGCSRISPGCENCYAERQAARFCDPGQWAHGFVSRDPNGARWTRRVSLISSALDEPLSWRKPCRVFVNSMSDLFHESLTDEQIDRVWAVMLLAPRHTFQVLTKRADRMRAYTTDPKLYSRVLRAAEDIRRERPELGNVGISNPVTFPARWIWLGVSVEDQQRANERIQHLLATPAAVKFLSCEPLLGSVDLERWLTGAPTVYGSREDSRIEPGPRRIDWCIAGGESGPGARPCNLGWIRSIVEQCRAARVPVFVKQLGARPVRSEFDDRGALVRSMPVHLRDRKGGSMDEWPSDLRVREFPSVAG